MRRFQLLVPVFFLRKFRHNLHVSDFMKAVCETVSGFDTTYVMVKAKVNFLNVLAVGKCLNQGVFMHTVQRNVAVICQFSG